MEQPLGGSLDFRGFFTKTILPHQRFLLVFTVFLRAFFSVCSYFTNKLKNYRILHFLLVFSLYLSPLTSPLVSSEAARGSCSTSTASTAAAGCLTSATVGSSAATAGVSSAFSSMVTTLFELPP